MPFVIAPASNRLDSVGGQTRSYDNVGNTINDGAGLVSVYSARNRLIRTTKAGLTTHYAHNAFGERVCKASAGPSCAQSPDRIEYLYDDDGHLVGEYGPDMSSNAEYLWLGDTPVAVLKRRPGSSDGGPGGGGSATPWGGLSAGGVDVYFVHPDHLDTPRVVVNAADQAVYAWDSAPFGDTAANENPTPGLPNFPFNLRFPGQQFDRETGTHYNYFRDYEAGTGRYVQSDPTGVEDDVASFNYVGLNSLSYADLLGLKRGPANNASKNKPNCAPCPSVRKNRHDYFGPKHAYQVRDKSSGEIHKVGVGSGHDDKSGRCKRQLDAIRASTGNLNFECETIKYMCGTKKIEQFEYARQTDLRSRGYALPGNQAIERPR